KLVAGLGLLHLEPEIPPREARGFPQRDENEPADPLDEAARRSAGWAFAALHKKRAVEEYALALPQRGQQLALMGGGGNVLRRDGMELEAAMAGEPASHVSLAMQVAAPELQHRQRRRLGIQCREQRSDGRLMPLGHRRRLGDAAQQGLQALVEMVDAGDVVQ